jgi:hypothetical protein
MSLFSVTVVMIGSLAPKDLQMSKASGHDKPMNNIIKPFGGTVYKYEVYFILENFGTPVISL